MIKAIIFDLGNVVVYFDQMITARKLEKYSNRDSNYIFEVITDKNLVSLIETSKITPEEFYKRIKERIGLKLDYNAFVEKFENMFTLNHDVYNLLIKLKNKYKVYALSNVNKIHFDYLHNKYKFLDIFHDITLSYKVKARKPDKKIYEYAINKAKVKPNEIVYIDDIKEFSDMATELGINGINYTNTEKLIQDLRKLNVSI